MTEQPEATTDRSTAADHGGQALIPDQQADVLAERWQDIQTRFVDDPRRAVADADELVTAAIDAIRDRFDRHREQLESRWQGDGEASTEDLRHVLQDYREFFSRLLDRR